MNKASKKSARCLALAALAATFPVSAYVVNITAADPTMIYLRVGDGSMSGGTYNSGGTPAANSTVNLVSVSVPSNIVGNGTAQAMNATGRLTSDLDGFAFCNANQIYIGGFYRRTGTTGANNASLTVVAPTTLTSGPRSIPMSQISWISSGNGDAVGNQPIPSGTFTGGSQTLVSNFARNTWRESCLAFSYANQNLYASGTYTATVTYTLAAL